MTDLSDSEKEPCPQCGAEVPEGAPNGLCPRCLMAGAMEPTGAPDQERIEPPGIEEVQEAFPQLEIIELIAAGGMGVVYKAKQTALNREVALKLLAPHREKEAGFSERFAREAQALAAMDHPNIVTVHDFGQSGGFYYLVMEFVDGVNLRQAMKAGKFEPKEALAIVPPICEALQYAHDQGIVHRDIKPENLLLDKSGKVKVADFGIARILDLSEPESGGTESREADSQLTVGMTLGTPNYMAPEQATSPENVDHRADIYSLGVVFYEMLTGESPKGSLEAPSTRVAVDVRLDEIVMRALADSPELRWQSAADLRTQVETVSMSAPGLPVNPTTRAPRKKGRVWKGLTIGLGILSIPLVIVGLFTLLAVIREGSWNPSWGEGFFVVSSWIAAILFSGGTILCLFGWLNSRESEKQRKPWRTASGIAVGLAALLLPVVVFGVMAVRTEQARSKEQQAIAIQAKEEAAQQIAVTLNEELARLENEVREETDPGLKKNLEEKRELLLAELEKTQLAHGDHGPEKSRRGGVRLGFATIPIVGLASLLLLITSIGLISRSVSGLAVGCGMGVLILVIGFFTLILSYRMLGASRAPGPIDRLPAVHSVPDRAGPVQVYISRPGITMTGDGAQLGFTMDSERLPRGWTIWSVIKKVDVSKGDPKLVSSHPRLLTEAKSANVTVSIRGVKWSDESRLNFEKIAPALNNQLTLKSGKPATLFTFTDQSGIQIRSTLELRPGGRISAIPGNIIFLREVRSEPGIGKLAVAWNDIQTVGAHELILETRGVSVQRSSQDSIELAYFKESMPNQPMKFSRLKIEGGGAFQFTFPPILEGPTSPGILPKPGRSLFVASGSQGVKLFEMVDKSTGHRVAAELKLVPVQSLPEIIPDLERQTDPESLFPIPE